MTWDLFFRGLGRFNAIAIFIVLIFVGISAITNLSRERQWRAESASNRESVSPSEGLAYTGQEITSADGVVIAYEAADSSGYDPRGGSNVSFTNMKSGETLMIAEGDENLVGWDVIYQQGGDRLAIGYVAKVWTKAQKAEGRMDVIVGTFPELTQHIVAPNVKYADSLQLHGAGTLSMIVWPEEKEAYFTVINMRDGSVKERKKVALPHIEANTDKSIPDVKISRQPDRKAPSQAPLNNFD